MSGPIMEEARASAYANVRGVRTEQLQQMKDNLQSLKDKPMSVAAGNTLDKLLATFNSFDLEADMHNASTQRHIRSRIRNLSQKLERQLRWHGLQLKRAASHPS